MEKRAFTLLEMMLVILLIAVATTFIVPTMMRPDNSPAQLAAERCYGLLTQLRNKAEIQGLVTGVRVDTRRYRFMHYAQGSWHPASLARAVTDVALPPTVQVALKQGDAFWQRVKASRSRLALHDLQLEMQQSAENIAPQVWFSPHEPPAPFSVQFRQQQPAECWEVSLRESGNIFLQACPEDNG